MQPVDITNMQDTLTFNEIDRIEALTGMPLSLLEAQAQGKLTRAMVIVAMERRGDSVTWNDLGDMNIDDVVITGSSKDSEDLDPT